jgi:hypothetical protein
MDCVEAAAVAAFKPGIRAAPEAGGDAALSAFVETFSSDRGERRLDG